MTPDEPKQTSEESPGLRPITRDVFDISALETMSDEAVEAEWLRRPEAWHMH